jgi:hypothetical protein
VTDAFAAALAAALGMRRRVDSADAFPALQQPRSDRSKRRKLRPPAVKRPLSGYMIFVQDRRKALADKHTGLSFRELGRKMGEMWATMPEEEKKKYNDLAMADRMRYRAEVHRLEAEASAQRPHDAEQHPDDMPEHGMVQLDDMAPHHVHGFHHQFPVMVGDPNIPFPQVAQPQAAAAAAPKRRKRPAHKRKPDVPGPAAPAAAEEVEHMLYGRALHEDEPMSFPPPFQQQP